MSTEAIQTRGKNRFPIIKTAKITLVKILIKSRGWDIEDINYVLDDKEEEREREGGRTGKKESREGCEGTL